MQILRRSPAAITVRAVAIAKLVGSGTELNPERDAALPASPGSHVPLHATSSGKLLLSLLPKPQRERLINQLPLRSFTETTIVDRASLERELEETRKRRVGINRAEHLRGMYGIAVPVMLDRRRACAALALQAPEGRSSIDELMSHVPALRDAADRIAGTFGPEEA